MKNLPKIKDLYGSVEVAKQNDQLTTLLNQPPAPEWVKMHPCIKGYKYIPIERVEYLLKTIFKRYRIEILREGTSFNGVFVVVRVHYLHPITLAWDYNDGIGAAQLQTSKGTSPADLANINNGALSMAFPIAKTIAIKDACDHFGKLFGSDLNRKEEINYKIDTTLIDLSPDHPMWEKCKTALISGNYTIEQIKEKYFINEENEELLCSN